MKRMIIVRGTLETVNIMTFENMGSIKPPGIGLIINAIPFTVNIVPKVMINESILAFTTPKPFIAPIAKPNTITATIPIATFIPIVSEAIAVEKAIIAPIDRSNPPDIMTIVSPKVAKRSGTASKKMLL